MTLDSTATSSPNFDVDFTTLATEFRNASYQNENTTDVGNTTSLGRGMPSPNFYLITTMAIISIDTVLSNVAVLAVLFQKENIKLAANRYLINIAIIGSTTPSCALKSHVIHNITSSSINPIILSKASLISFSASILLFCGPPEGISADRKLVEAIRKMNTPEIAQEMESLLGLSAYVSRMPTFCDHHRTYEKTSEGHVSL
ncbi:hypothetical protein LSAT2_028450 [Lamellibrachia satsuma]|nr:hypothetical protein LSAT2_028450 [Lamellibrachia satsuma]